MSHHLINCKSFGPPRYFRPICIRHRHGYYGGPAGYEETDDPQAKPRTLIIQAWRDGEITLAEARDELDMEENHD